MALFIHQENQKILWSAINQSILFQNLGDSRETWFRNAVEQFYKKISGISINHDLLQKINKDFIQDMLKVLKTNQPIAQHFQDMLKVLKTNQPIAQPVQPPPPTQFYQPINSHPNNSHPNNSHPINSQQSNSQQSNSQQSNSQQSNSYYNPNPSYYDPHPSRYTQPSQLQQQQQQQQQQHQSSNIQYSLEPTNTVSRDYLSDQKQSEITKQFTDRLDQYNNMIAKNIPVANFKEGQLDEPITNMDALIKQHMIDRDQVLQYATTSNQINNTRTNSPPILKIQETLDKPIENIIEFRTDDSPNMINQIKNVNQQGNSVHWSANQDSIFALKTKVDYIAEELNTLKTELRDEFTKGFLDLRTLLLSQHQPKQEPPLHQYQYIQSEQSPAP